MLNYKKNKLLLILILIILVQCIIFSSTEKNNNDATTDKKKNEQKLQFGFGMMVSSSNLLNIIESIQLYESTKNDTDYNFPGIDDEEQEALQELDGAMKRAILIANILGGMEYGLQFRILYKIMMFESDLIVLPFDGSYNGRLDLLLTPMIGIRAPFFIMPYFIIGPAFTFSFYPYEFTSVENWKGDWAATSNFAFRPGLNTRFGLDLKFKNLSIGAYYQWTVKDFQEFTSWYWHIMNVGYSNIETLGKILAAQSRFGISICLYPF